MSYSYDASSVANSKGHLTSLGNAYSTTNYTNFDAVGNVLASSQVTAGQTYGFAYAYNLARALTAETYPSGRVINTAYDGANRPVTVNGALSGPSKGYVTGSNYWPHGAPYWHWYGNNVVPVSLYNNRLQINQIYATVNNTGNTYLWIQNYNWGTTNNNGNIQGLTTYAGGPGPPSSLALFTESFGYDGVSRLTSSSDTGGWSRNFGYDTWANMWVTGNTGVPLAGNTPTSNVFNSSNKIVGGSYDASGNQLVVNGDTLLYDAENRVILATDNVTQAVENYTYDGGGQRVEKIGPSGTVVFVYDALGQLASEFSTAAASSACATCYLTYDHLGSVRLVTDQNAAVVARHDYLPYGEEIPANTAGRNGQWGSTTDVSQKFTGQFRDSETGMDYFHARYFGGAQGRFNSPDPRNAGADRSDPQTWNAYAYVRGNPLRGTDPTGLARIDVDTLALITANYDPAWFGGGPPCFACGYGGGNGSRGPSLGDSSARAEAFYENQVDAGFYAHGADPGPPTRKPARPTVTMTLSQPAEDTVPGIDIWHGQQKLWSDTAAVGNGLAAATAAVVAAPIAIDLTSAAIYSGSPSLFAGETPVIGRLADTAAYIGRSGYNVLNLPADTYSLAAQSTWMGQTVVSGQSYLLASPFGGATGMFATEGGFLQSIGYELSSGGSFLLPPLP